MDKFLESLVNDGLPPPGQAREDAMFIMLASLDEPTACASAYGLCDQGP